MQTFSSAAFSLSMSILNLPCDGVSPLMLALKIARGLFIEFMLSAPNRSSALMEVGAD